MAIDFSKFIYANSANPYEDMYGRLERSTNDEYNRRVGEEKARRKDYLSQQADIRNQWRGEQSKARDAYREQAERDNADSQKQTNAGYDSSGRANYINYMQAQKALPSSLNALGIRGGATESSLVRLGSNYGTNVANNEAARNTALADLRKAYEKALADYETAYNDRLSSYDDTYNQRIASYNDTYNSLMSNLAAERQQSLTNAKSAALENQLKWEKEQQDKDLERFSGVVEGLYNDTADYDALIDQLKKSNDPNKDYKIMLATRAKNALAATQAAASSSGGGGGYSRGYSSGGYGGGSSSGGSSGGGGSSYGAYSQANAQAAKAQAHANQQAGVLSHSPYYKPSTGSGSGKKTYYSNRGDYYVR